MLPGHDVRLRRQPHIHLNDARIDRTAPLVRVNGNIKPGETNTIAIVCLNKQGPGGIVAPVTLATGVACGSH